MLEIEAEESRPVIQPNAHDRHWECPVRSVHLEYVRVFFGELSTNQILEGPIIPPNKVHFELSGRSRRKYHGRIYAHSH